jgi:glyoxylase-like metal-dependent hydrolase (beta-lactamase superfamily II)
VLAARLLLVDTLFDLRLTSEMLAAMRGAVPAAARIDTLVNTHSNGDTATATIRPRRRSSRPGPRDEMAHETPAVLAEFQRRAPEMGPLGAYVLHCFGAFHFDGITPRLPTRTFEGRLDLSVGTKRVELIEVGPAHTRGDAMVFVPGDRTIFTGDILFIEGTPIVWAGPVQNWIGACERILALDVETIVPATDHDARRRAAATSTTSAARRALTGPARDAA